MILLRIPYIPLQRISRPSFLLAFLLLTVNIYSQCGSERWNVKILQDAEAGDINFSAIKSTVSKQLALTKPEYHESNLRDITEKKVYKIDCILVKYRLEDDSDWHLVVKDLTSNREMVVELPSPNCVDMSNPHFGKLIVSRKRLQAKVGPIKSEYRKPPAGTKIEVIGVGFFDKRNHPQGFKGRELHPVLELKVLS